MRLLRRNSLAMAGLGIALGIALGYLALADTDLAQVKRAIAAIRLDWMLVAVALYAADIALRVVRWHRLLPPQPDRRLGDAAYTLIVGYAANNLLPARLGELVRADISKRRFGLTRSTVLGSIVVERLIDLAAVLACLCGGLVLTSLRPQTLAVAEGLKLAGLGGLILLAVLLGLLAARQFRDRAAAWLARLATSHAKPTAKLATLAGRILDDVAIGMRVMSEGGARQVLALSLCLWMAETAAICAVLMAVDCPWDLAMGLSVVGVASLGTLIPTAPAYLGSYQLSYMIALGWYGIAPATAIAAATAVQIGLIGTLTVIGMILVGTRMVLAASRRPSGSSDSTGRQGL